MRTAARSESSRGKWLVVFGVALFAAAGTDLFNVPIYDTIKKKIPAVPLTIVTNIQNIFAKYKLKTNDNNVEKK